MPLLSQIQLPLPKDWTEFEDIVASAIGARGTRTDPRRYGRKGQAQHGVDIFYEDNLARNTGVQCKLQTEFSAKEVNDAVTEAEKFHPALETFVIALGLPRDAKLSAVAHEISAQRAPAQKFRVCLMFWDDIQDDLARDPTELSKHYPQFFPPLIPQPASHGARLSDRIGMRRHEALGELSSFRLGCLPARNHPDMDWPEVCEIIALNLGKHSRRIASLREKFVADLPREVETILEMAEVAAEDGNFDLAQFSTNGDIPDPAAKAAGRMYDHLKEAEDKLKSFLEENHGFKF